MFMIFDKSWISCIPRGKSGQWPLPLAPPTGNKVNAATTRDHSYSCVDRWRIALSTSTHTVYSQVEIDGAGCVVCNTDILCSIIWFHIANFQDGPDKSQPIDSHSQLFINPREGRRGVAGSNTRKHSRTSSLSDCRIVRDNRNLGGICNLIGIKKNY